MVIQRIIITAGIIKANNAANNLSELGRIQFELLAADEES